MIIPEGDDLVDNFDVGEPPPLRFANLFRVAPAFGDEVDRVEHFVEGTASQPDARSVLVGVLRQLKAPETTGSSE